jgi:hypothetical protein
MANQVANLPFGAAGLNVPVLGIIDETEEITAFFADYIQHRVFAAVIHGIDC